MGVHGISGEFTGVALNGYIPSICVNLRIHTRYMAFLDILAIAYPMLCHMAALAVENKANLSTSSA